MPAVETAGPTERFGDTEALREVDLEVPEATVLGVLGPNGAEYNPFTVATDAIRALYNGTSPGNDLRVALIGAAAIISVCGYLSFLRFTTIERA